MPRRRVFSVTAAVFAGVVIGVGLISHRSGVPLLPGPARRQALVEKKLRNVLPVVEFRGTRLDKAVERLRAAAGIDIAVDWDDLESEGISRVMPIDLKLRHVTLGAALKAVLGYADSAHRAELDYIPYDGSIIICAGAASERYASAAVYDLSDIQWAASAASDQVLVCFPPQAPPSRGLPGAPGVAGAAPPLTPRQQMDAQLQRLIEDDVTPDVWDTNGGSGGFVRAFGGRVVVVAGIRTHRRIEKLVNQLRAMPGAGE